MRGLALGRDQWMFLSFSLWTEPFIDMNILWKLLFHVILTSLLRGRYGGPSIIISNFTKEAAESQMHYKVTQSQRKPRASQLLVRCFNTDNSLLNPGLPSLGTVTDSMPWKFFLAKLLFKCPWIIASRNQLVSPLQLSCWWSTKLVSRTLGPRTCLPRGLLHLRTTSWAQHCFAVTSSHWNPCCFFPTWPQDSVAVTAILCLVACAHTCLHK